MNVCTGAHYGCGEVLPNQKTRVTRTSRLVHNRNTSQSFFLGATEIVVNKNVRTFQMDTMDAWQADPASFVMQEEGGPLYFRCAPNGDSAPTSHSVEENNEYTTTVLHFLDTRYNNAIGTETKEVQTFSYSGEDMVEFQGTWGGEWFHKFKIINHRINHTISYFIVVNGAKTILKTNVTETLINGPDNPLILLSPNPVTNSGTWINDKDLDEYGFYDYYGEGYTKILEDGGDDYYFTDWMRRIGAANLNQDQRDASNRYYQYYLDDPPSEIQSLDMPELHVDASPIGSITQDKEGNVFYSVTFGGETFNSLTNGNLPQLFPDYTQNTKFYPIGLL